MDPASIQALFRFNTFANDGVREGLLTADDELLRRPLDLWYGTVFSILSHIYSGEAGWLRRLRDGESSARGPGPEAFASGRELAEAWRAKDLEWEAWVGSLTPEDLAADITARRSDGNTYAFKRWQPIVHVAVHGIEHRGHATVGMTQLGIKHSGQDFLDQFRTRV